MFFKCSAIPVSVGKPEHLSVSMVAVPLHSRVELALLVEELELLRAGEGHQMTVQISKLGANLHCILKCQVP